MEATIKAQFEISTPGCKATDIANKKIKIGSFVVGTHKSLDPGIIDSKICKFCLEKCVHQCKRKIRKDISLTI